MRLMIPLWIAAAVAFASGPQQEIQPVAPSGVIAALLADGRIMLLDVATGRPLADYTASSQPRETFSGGRLARAAAGDEVFAVLPGNDGPVVAGLNVRTLTGRTVGRLPADKYRGLAVGRRTGRIFAFRSLGAKVEVLDAATGEGRNLFTFAPDRVVLSGAISADEQRVYISYHADGAHAPGTGIEWFDLKEQGWQRGSWVSSHGDFAVVGNVLLAATGDSEILEVNDAAEVVRSVDTGFSDFHLMEFAVDPERRIVYAAGDCIHVGAGGLTATPWPQSGALPTRILSPLHNSAVCGNHISLEPAGKWMAIVRRVLVRNSPTPQSRTVMIVDSGTGKVLQQLTTSSDVIDVLAIR